MHQGKAVKLQENRNCKSNCSYTVLGGILIQIHPLRWAGSEGFCSAAWSNCPPILPLPTSPPVPQPPNTPKMFWGPEIYPSDGTQLLSLSWSCQKDLGFKRHVDFIKSNKATSLPSSAADRTLQTDLQSTFSCAAVSCPHSAQGKLQKRVCAYKK